MEFTSRVYSKPPSLMSERIIEMQDDEIFYTITQGAAEMPAHAGQIDRDDRWKAVLHIRALQQQR